MRRAFLIAIAAVLTAGLFGTRVLGEGGTVNPAAQKRAAEEKEREARLQIYQLAARLLDGRLVRVRIYTNPVEQPEAFQQVTVPLKGLTLSCDAIRSAYGSISDKMPILVLGRDQTDSEVAKVLNDFIRGGMYKPGGTIDVWPSLFDDPGYEWWIFRDALGDPIAGASVEIALYNSQCEARIIVGRGTLDEQGRLKRIKGANFSFTVSHPNYGIGTIQSQRSEVENLPESYVLAMIPLDSPAAAGAIRGTVTDPQDKPVAGADISCMQLVAPGGERLNIHDDFLRKAITNEQGQFAMYGPVVRDGVPSADLIPAGSVYDIVIEPDKSLNLRRHEGGIIAGANPTIVLAAMQADEFFHRFTFEGHAGPITDPQELKGTVLTLYRDDRQWAELKYDQWKDGCSLPLGTLGAQTGRWGYSFMFKPIDLQADSPEEIVIKEYDPVVYRGKVIDGATGEPVPNVIVFAGPLYATYDPCSMPPQQWQELRSRAAEQASARFPARVFYENDRRVTVTDPNGEYEMVLVPGANHSFYAFTALQPGYPPVSANWTYERPDPDGIVQVAPLRLSPPAPPEVPYFPTLTFEDETGPVTDPNKLKVIQLRIDQKTSRFTTSLENFPKMQRFRPGIYSATGAWDGKYYVFAPVDLTESRPETVVFKPRKVLKNDIVFQGVVVNGVTGRVIPGAVVVDRPPAGQWLDASRLTAEQWQAVKSLGPDANPADPAMAPLMQILTERPGRSLPQIAIADPQGRFRITLSRKEMDLASSLIVVEKDFLTTEQRLMTAAAPGENPSASLVAPDRAGTVTLPPTKLFPAGAVVLEPVVPGEPASGDRRVRLSLRMVTAEDDPTPWLKDLWSAPKDNSGAFVSSTQDLRPNARQSVSVPAGVRMTLLVYDTIESPWAPLAVPSIQVQQGETVDVGRLELGPGVTIVVKVIDPAGNPFKGARLNCHDDRWGYWGVTAMTNSAGITQAHVAPSSKGKFSMFCPDETMRGRLEAIVPYEVAGAEDDGREFVLQLPVAFAERLRELRQAQQEAAPPAPPQPLPPSRYSGQKRR